MSWQRPKLCRSAPSSEPAQCVDGHLAYRGHNMHYAKLRKMSFLPLSGSPLAFEQPLRCYRSRPHGRGSPVWSPLLSSILPTPGRSPLKHAVARACLAQSNWSTKHDAAICS
jgi:hypothetical protein